MKSFRNLPLQPRRDAWVEVNLGALEHNARALRRLLPPDVAVMAIVKADAYGHGAAMVLPVLEASGVSMAGVASIDEAIQIREAGIKMPVLVIGVVPDWAVQVASGYDIQLTVFEEHHLHSLKNAKKPIKVHVKVDTGMHRIGVDWREAPDFIRQCREQPSVQLEGVFSHLASAEDPEYTRLQLERWQSVLAQIDPPPRHVHMANSLGALRFPEAHGNLVRTGIALFGYGPEKTLKPVMGLHARIMRIQEVDAGMPVSYGHGYKTPHPARIATLPLGYADGVPRALSNRIEGLLYGHRVPQVGAITMDQMMFDVTGVPEAAVGDKITLLGKDGGDAIWLDDWAGKAGTIEYELMCALRVRLPKTYTR